MVDRVRRELSDDDIAKIASTYHRFRAKPETGLEPYEDEAGFCKAATLEEIKANDYVLTPGRYVGAEEEEDDGVPFEGKYALLREKLLRQFEEEEKFKLGILSLIK